MIIYGSRAIHFPRRYCIALRMEEETEIYGEQGRSQRCRMPGQFIEVRKADIADILTLPAY